MKKQRLSHAEQLQILDPEVFELAVARTAADREIPRAQAALKMLDSRHFVAWFVWHKTFEGYKFWLAWNDFLNDPAPLERRIRK